MDSPVDEPDEEHATASVPNAKERMDPAWRMQSARADATDSARVGAERKDLLMCGKSRNSLVES